LQTLRSHRFRKSLVKTRSTVKSVTELNEGPWRWAVGIQAGIAIGVPVALFTYTGHQSYGLIASLGGLISLYGVAQSTIVRLRILPFVIAGLVVSSFCGVLTAGNAWSAGVGIVLVGILFSLLSFGTGLGAPGPVIFLLVTAISTRLASPAIMGGAGMDGALIVVLITMGAILAYLCIVLLSGIPYMRKLSPDPETPELSWRIRFDKEMKLVTIRVIIAVILAMVITKPLGIQRSYWVIVAAAAILQGGRDRKLTTVRAIQRVLGTILGVVVFYLINWFHPEGIWVVVIVMLFQFATQVVITRNYVLGLIFITPLALVNSTVGHAATAMVTVRERILDTIFGAIIALVVFWVEDGISRFNKIS
jgi:MFS family permease